MIHHVFANRSNAGDWLSAIGIQSLLRPLPVIEHLCDEPFVPDTLRALERLGSDDLVVIGGGGLFMDYFGPFWEGFLSLSRRVRFVVWGVGFVDLVAESSRLRTDLLRSVLRHAAHVTVRDELTRDILSLPAIGPVALCPSVVAVEPRALGHGLLHVAALTTVGAEAYAAMVLAGRRSASASGRRYREVNNRFEGGRAGLDAVLASYAASDIVLSARLHGCIVALAMGRPTVAVSGDRKIDAFMKAVGLADWVVGRGEVDAVTDLLGMAVSQPRVGAAFTAARVANERIAALVRELAGCQPDRGIDGSHRAGERG